MHSGRTLGPRWARSMSEDRFQKPGPGIERAAAARTILIVEDEMLLAMMLEGMLGDLGHTVLKAARVSSGVRMATEAAIDCAILDVNLNGETSYPVADALRKRGMPFVFATGYGEDGVHADYRGVPVLTKPYREHDLERILTSVLPLGTWVA
jgi:CheY-like chemotaxis protein